MEKSLGIINIIRRIIISTIIFGLNALFSNWINLSNFWEIIIFALFISILDYLLNCVFNRYSKTFIKSFISFIVFVPVIFISQFFIDGLNLSMLTCIVAGFIYSIFSSAN